MRVVTAVSSIGADDFAGRLRPTLERMAAGSPRDNAAVLSDLRSLRVGDAASLEQCVALVCELLTRQPYVFRRVAVGPGAYRSWASDEANAPVGPMAGSWLRDFDEIVEIVFRLYEEDYGTTRETLHELTRESPRIPYLNLFVMNALFDLERVTARGASKRRVLEAAIRGLLGADRALLRWAEAKRRRGVLLKELGGLTNTVVGMYDWVARTKRTGWKRLPRRADAFVDLGGGYGTPDLARVLGLPLVCFDLAPPTRARAIGIRRFRASKRPGSVKRALARDWRWQTDREARRYFEALEAQPWERFDVFRDSFDAAWRSIVVTSFGFMTSTVASHSDAAPRREELGRNVLAQMATTYAAVLRVIEPVARGADVSLLTCQRATSRAYANVTAFLRFRDRSLADSALWEAPFQLGRAGSVPPAKGGAGRLAAGVDPGGEAR